MITVAFVIVALGAGLYFSRHFVGNIEELNDYMSAVAAGDYRVRYCVTGSDEFRQLNARLNTLVHTIGEDIRSLRDETQTDPLCNIRNRRFVLAELDRLLKECATTKKPPVKGGSFETIGSNSTSSPDRRGRLEVVE